ncbi:response regulator [Paucibacter sp. AS339]|uniref:response regulator n=1 Tax=Paucibacter hankyongi TaxID=3133434 RepID=UPI0030AA914B
MSAHILSAPPTQALSQPVATTTTATTAAKPKSGRLLYIEDNAVNMLVVEELVASRPQLSLACAEDGRRGLQCARDMQPELILLDMHLPDFDGYEVLRRLRADPSTAHIPCIALSANAMDDDMRRAIAAGFLAYWTKPIDFKAFLAGLDAFFAPSPSLSAGTCTGKS